MLQKNKDYKKTENNSYKEGNMTPSQLSSYLDVIFAKKSKHSTFIWGGHGVGKSSILRSSAEKHGYTVIDFRISQVESIDVAGMYYPAEVNGVTAIQNLAPTYFLDMIESALKNNGQSKICLFFDEHNMGRRETMNATFEQVLDRKVKGKKMPEDVIIVCAGNPETDDYDTTTMSESLKDRLVHVYLSADRNDFVSWAAANNIHKDVLTFASSGHMNFEDAGFRAKLKPSSRSLARLSDLLKLGFDKAVEDEVILGVLGVELGVQFIKNRQEPEKAFDAEEMLSFASRPEDFHRFKSYCNPENTRLDILNTSMISFANFVDNHNIQLSDSQVDSIGMFMMELPAELLYKFWKDVNTNYEKSYKSQKTIESITIPMYTGRLSALKDRVLSLTPEKKSDNIDSSEVSF
jgi:hypothetical protein